MSPKRPDIVERLREAIADSGQSGYAVAKGADIDQSVLNRFVNCERGISLETAAKLCQYLDLDLVHRR